MCAQSTMVATKFLPHFGLSMLNLLQTFSESVRKRAVEERQAEIEADTIPSQGRSLCSYDITELGKVTLYEYQHLDWNVPMNLHEYRVNENQLLIYWMLCMMFVDTAS